jgi:hypothetical protein
VCAELGQIGPLRAQGKEKEKGLPAWSGCGLKEERERERGKGFCFFFKFSFSNSFFKHSNKIHALET